MEDRGPPEPEWATARVDDDEVMRLDHEFETAAQTATARLLHFRWAQTLGPGGRSYREYARLVHRAHVTIRKSARGWEILQQDGTPGGTGILTPLDAYHLGGQNDLEQEVTMAVAEAWEAPPADVAKMKRPGMADAKERARIVLDLGGSHDQAVSAAAPNPEEWAAGTEPEFGLKRRSPGDPSHTQGLRQMIGSLQLVIVLHKLDSDMSSILNGFYKMYDPSNEIWEEGFWGDDQEEEKKELLKAIESLIESMTTWGGQLGFLTDVLRKGPTDWDKELGDELDR